MKIFILVLLFLQLSGISVSRFSPTWSQQILQGSVGITEANIKHLLAVHYDDPVEVIRLLDPVYAAILDEPRLVEISGNEPVWMTERDKIRLKKQGLSFTDLTGHENLSRSTVSSDGNIEWPVIRHQERVEQVIRNMKVEEMVHNLSCLTTFYNRYYRSHYGAQSSRWIYNKVLEIVADAPPNVHLSLETFTHEFPQISVIARFEPTRRSRPNHAIKIPLVIIGSHLDSANYEFPMLPAPGADDGGSGTVAILEAFRALVQTAFRPSVPVEFHWYAAEEGGLLGSQDIVSEYVYRRKDIGAMIQFDMTAYVHKDTIPTMTFITNNVHSSLTNWTMNLASEYSSSPVTGAKLFPGGVSDHLSWRRAGVPVVCATESDPVRTPNPFIHTADDRTVVKEGEFSFEYALEFAKLAAGFAVELGGWDN